MAFARKIREVPLPNSLDDILLKCVSLTKVSIRICAAKGYQVSADYSGLKRQGPESP